MTYVFDVDRMDRFDDQRPAAAAAPDPRFFPDHEEFKGGESPSLASHPISATAANVVLRELCQDGTLRLRLNRHAEAVYLCLLESADLHGEPIFLLQAGWEAWYEMLGLLLDGCQRQELPYRETQQFQGIPVALSRARPHAEQIDDDGLRDEVLSLLSKIERAYTGNLSAEQLTSEQDDLSQQWEELIERIEEELEETADHDRVVGGDLQDLIEDELIGLLTSTETRLYDLRIATWSDGMTWGDLDATRQIEIVSTLIDERLDPASLLAAIAIQRHPGTAEAAASLLAISEMPRLLHDRVKNG